MNPTTPNTEPKPSTQPRKVVTGGSLYSIHSEMSSISLGTEQGSILDNGYSWLDSPVMLDVVQPSQLTPQAVGWLP